METTQEIIAKINEELDTQAGVNNALTGMSTSNVAEWVTMKAKVAAACYSLVRFWLAFKAEILALIAGKKEASQAWWLQTMMAYQDGDPLPEGKTTYATIDASKQIITRVSITKDSNGVLQIKVAKASGKLSPEEFTRVEDYIEEVKPFGAPTRLISIDADEMKAIINIAYDGKLIKASVLALVEAAIVTYLDTIRFDGVFNINILRNAIQEVPGVMEGGVDIVNVQIKESDGEFLTVLGKYQPKSGYYNYLTDDSVNNMIAA